MIPLYILGLLQRFGPQHGYQIKKIISEQLADFTQIKLPAIYYHLEKMAHDGFLLADSEKNGTRPEKTVYSVTDKGKAEFLHMLERLLDFDYRPSFSSDGAFYFAEYLDRDQITTSLKAYGSRLDMSIETIGRHRQDVLNFVPDTARWMVQVIFDHHLKHYKAERAWVRDIVTDLDSNVPATTKKEK